MAKSKATFEKSQRERAKRQKRLEKAERKRMKEKEETVNIEDMTPEELMRHHAESEGLTDQDEL